jgi:taurine dioxygenase
MRTRPLHPDIGVEVLDVDLDDTSPAEIDAVREALDRHKLLLFHPGRRIAPERQVEITRWFGPLITYKGAEWGLLSNSEDSGTRKLPFHCDYTFTDHPVQLITLQAIELPTNGSATAFASNARAWRALEPERQAQLEGLTLRHQETEKDSEGPLVSEACHPLRLLHPRTGEPILYATENHAERILELAPDESERMLAELMGVLYAPEHVYAHVWQLYDFLIWDNVALQHARPERAEPAAGPRVLQRAAVGEASYEELVAHGRRRAAAEARAN